ncbi:flagellar basal body P-ring formation chaperone FlgA [Aliagarivorans marinus]|uniref:flagellar basal body P-ring formation chaperone FlgA n=1 Tax=Aliagarivorans marinus TaxID=561965 RepID=UPI00042019A4|nr:flagellar basal body P-ring formation chaperone FlgA [Aliagarivorans marinus]
MINFLVVVAGLLTSFVSFASDKHVELQSRAEAFVAEFVDQDPATKTELTANTLDPRTQIIDCPSDFQFELASGEVRRNTSVLVTCAEDINWRLYIPVRITQLVAAVTVVKNLDPGTTLDASTLELSYVPSNLARGNYYIDPSDLFGAKVKRQLRKDRVITGRDICIVCKDDIVNISAGVGGLSVSTEGTALSDGSLGDNIRIRNNQSQRIVTGRVVGLGRVSVNF